MGRAMVAKHDRQPGHTFPANQSDLDFLAAALNGDDRREACLRKIDCFDALVGLLKHLPQLKGHRLEMRREQIKVARRKGGKQSVAAAGHRALLAFRREHRTLSHRRLQA